MWSELFENMEGQYLYHKEDKKERRNASIYLLVLSSLWNIQEQKLEWSIQESWIETINKINWRRKWYSVPVNNGNSIVPKGVTSIQNGCFNNCSSLTNIGVGAFSSRRGEKVQLKMLKIVHNYNIRYDAFKDYWKVIYKWNSFLILCQS